jgi:NhaP-type Na+/H+ or K+/H+ antiporter
MCVCVDLGLAVFALQVGYHIKLILWSLVACLIGRAAFVFPLSCIINRKRSKDRVIPMKHQLMIWFSGFRGALCFALALDWPNEKRSVKFFLSSQDDVIYASIDPWIYIYIYIYIYIGF